jgi:glucokinase
MDYAVGIDLGGTLIKAVAVTFDGKIIYKTKLETRDTSKSESLKVRYWVSSINQQIMKIQQRQKGGISCIGVTAPGLVDQRGTSIQFMPGRLKGLEGLVWSESLKHECPVSVLNDAHAALIGENWIGAATGFKDVAMLTLGTGVGGAIMMEGKIVLGRIGRAGHMGHICLDPFGIPDFCRTPGSLEWFVGDYSLKERSGGRYSSNKELVEGFQNGDYFATTLWLQTVRILACGIVSIINTLDPQAVILGGGLIEAEEALFNPLFEILEEIEWKPGGTKVKIIQACLKEYGGAIGVAKYALQRCTNRNL